MSQLAAALDAPIDALPPELKTIYQDFHCNPELSMQEIRTAGIAAAYLAAHSIEVTRGVGDTDPTLKTGLQTMLTAASAWLCKSANAV